MAWTAAARRKAILARRRKMGTRKRVVGTARRVASRGKRTASGKPSAAARRQHGFKSGSNRKGSFPVFDKKSARSALKLRGKANNRAAVIAKVSRYANKTNDKTLKAAVKRARAADRKRKK